MDTGVALLGSEQKSILVVATGWGPSFGGINAFSLDFCLALSRLLKGTARVICLTTPVDDTSKTAAAEQEIEIHAIPGLGSSDPIGTAEIARELLDGAGIEQLDLIIGHDVFTGPVAIALRSLLGGVAAVIHHMSYGSYQAVKAHGQIARQKEEEEQQQLLCQADAVLAVGPLLKRSAESLCQRPVQMIVPGLAEIESIKYRTGYFRAIAFGRLGRADDRVKQGSLAAAGYGRFIKLASKLTLQQEHRFNVFGLTAEEYAAEEKAICDVVNMEAERLVNVVACPYTEKREELFSALSHNEVAMMLSWHEGFGLVGWEAIAACVPLIASETTGLYALLRDDNATFGADCVNVVKVRGSPSDTLNGEDVAAVANTLLQIATNFPAALGRAQRLRDHLRPLYSWEGCARTALEACGWKNLLPLKPEPTARRTEGSIILAGMHPRAGAFRDDINTLLAHSRETITHQGRFSSIKILGATVKVQRSCVPAMVTAARQGSLLVVGEPGAGKTGAQHDAVEELVASGADVLMFAAEGLASESLGELRNELGLEHELVEVLDNWSGESPGYLVIDALDAARSEGVARTLRDLLARVIGRNGRWRIVASIRKFDLRYSSELRRLLPGTPVIGFENPEFAQVRHLNIPLLDDSELSQVTAQSNELQSVLAAASHHPRDLLRVPFNLSLAAASPRGGRNSSRVDTNPNAD